ncbi:MAG TPA: glycerol-3-phosphate acyltransferase [Anaerolineales bacterium]|nr:glycerol-3-phosphate acyltransferase [Anaerolineales bacterium]
MNCSIAVAILIASYLIGSISFARLVTKIWAGKDVTQFEIPVEGTDDRYKVLSIGANSVSSVLGAKAGMTVSLLDILKTFLPTLLCKLFFPEIPLYTLTAALGGLIGHVWPLYYKFHGGSGFSAIMGGLLVIDPLAVIATPVAGIILGLLIFRNLIVTSLAWIWLLIPWFWWRTSGDPTYLIYSVVINVIFILAMIPEIKVGLKYKREGKTMEYGIGSLSSNPMGRGMLKMARSLGFMKEGMNKE